MTTSTRRTITQKPKADIQEDLFMAASLGDLQWLQNSVRREKIAKLNVKQDENGLNVLHLACKHGRLESIRYLVEQCQMDVNFQSRENARPINFCLSKETKNRALPCIEFLVENGANVNAIDHEGSTALHQAASEGNMECLQLLLQRGADSELKDHKGSTALDLAKLWCNKPCARLLQSHKWHRDKTELAKQVREMSKYKMQQVLADIEEEIEKKANDGDINPQAYKSWLKAQGIEIDEKTKKPMPSETMSHFKRRPNQFVANSRRRDPNWKQQSNEMKTKPDFPQRRIQTVHHEIETKERYRRYSTSTIDSSQSSRSSTRLPKVIDKPELFFNPKRWNFSPSVPSSEYVPILRDIYPRDPLTMLPDRNAAPQRTYSEIRQEVVSKFGTPRRDTSRSTPRKRSRKNKNIVFKTHPVVFRCKTITDVPTKRKLDERHRPRDESAFHFGNDPDSVLLKLQANMLTARPNKTTGYEIRMNGVNGFPRGFSSGNIPCLPV